MCPAKHLKSRFLTVALQNYTKINFKRLLETCPTYFTRTFLQRFSNRPYPNVKIILAYFCLQNYLKFITTLSFGYFSNTFTSFNCSKFLGIFGIFKQNSLFTRQSEDSFL